MVVFIKHIEIEVPGTLGEFFNNQTSWQTKIVELGNGEILPSLDDCEAIISLGGPMNVYEEDKYPFLQEEDKLLKKAIKESFKRQADLIYFNFAKIIAESSRVDVS